MTAAINMRDGCVDRNGRTIWHDVDLDIAAGEFVAILGPNGVGKSTLLHAILGLVPLRTGTLTVLGEAPGRANRAIGYLPQRRGFDPSLRIRGVDIVRLGIDGDHWGISLSRRHARRVRTRVDELVTLVGAETYATKPIGECSGGEQQRLLIAQALAREPAMLLLDEPLDSLDLASQASVAALIARICHDEGVTVLIVAHDVNPILGHLDRVVYLGSGGVLTGTPTEVITSENLTALYNSPVEVLHASDGRLVVVGQPDLHPHAH
jgi:zinc/manganese transport system ATP-binding protein